MTGKSMRFKNAGISIPKQFLTVNKKMIIEHVLDLFPNESDINFIVNEEEFKNKSLADYFKIFESIKKERAHPASENFDSKYRLILKNLFPTAQMFLISSFFKP